MSTRKAIAIQKMLMERGFDEGQASDLIEFVENLNGERVTKKDLDLITQYVQQSKQELTKDMQQFKQELEGRIDRTKEGLEHRIEQVKRDVTWLKWILAGIIALIFGLAGMVHYLHNDTKENMKDMEARIMQAIESHRHTNKKIN